MIRSLLWLLVALPLGGCPAQVPQTARAAPISDELAASTVEVVAVVSQLRGLEGWTIVPLGHFQRGRRHALILWPALDGAGRLVDATVVGVLLEETDEGELREQGRRWVVREREVARAALTQAIGGEDFEQVGPGAGAPLDDLGPELGILAREFADAVSAGRRRDAASAATAFARLLPVERAAFEPAVARLLWMASAHSASLEHVSTSREGQTARLTLRVVRSSVVLRTITATAASLERDPERWVVVSYQE